MPAYEVTDPSTGAKLRFEGNSPPSQDQIRKAFSQNIPAPQTPRRLSARGVIDRGQSPEVFQRQTSEQEVRSMLRDAVTPPDIDHLSMGNTPAQTAYRTLAQNTLNLIGGVPAAVGDFAGNAFAGVNALADYAGNNALGRETTLSESMARQQNIGLAKDLRDTPGITVNDVVSFASALPALIPGGKTFTEARQQERDKLALTDAVDRNENPSAARMADVGADVFALIGMRRPFARGISNAERALLTRGEASRVSDLFTRSPALRKVARGAGRTMEAGLEAYVLDTLKGNDPTETAMLVAAGQMGGSLALSLNKGLLSTGGLGKFASLGINAFAAASLLQLADTAAPGGNNYILPNIEQGYEKVLLSMVAGATAGMIGAGRLRGTKLDQISAETADALAAIPRGAMISLATSIDGASPAERERALFVSRQLIENPETFDAEAIARLERSLTGRAPDLLAAINDLSESNQSFREALQFIE